MSTKHTNGWRRLASPATKRQQSAPRSEVTARGEKGARERLNLRFLACLIAAGLVLTVSWYFVHRWQVRRNAAALLRQTDQAEAQERLDRAARLLRLYVGLVPDDIEGRTRYGLLLERLAENSPAGRQEALAVFEQVLFRDPDRQDIRRRAAGLAVDLGHFDDALQHLNALPPELASEGEVLEWFGRAYEGRAQYPKAAQSYRKSVVAAPGRITPYLRLAHLLRDRLARADEAETTLEKLIKANGQSFQAYLGRVRYRLEGTLDADNLKAARQDMEEALRLAPQKIEVLLEAAELAFKLPDGLKEARQHLNRVLELRPQEIRGYEGLARVELMEGHSQEAMRVFRRGLEKLPDDPALSWNLANLLIQQEDPSEGEEMLGQLDKLAIPRPRRDFLRAVLQLRRGDWTAGRKQLEAVRPLIANVPQLTVQCDLLLAECCERAGELETEVLVCRRSIALAPQQTAPRLRLATALQRLGRVAEALDEAQRMTALPAPPPAAWTLLANLMIQQTLRLPPQQQQWEEIERTLDRAAQATQDPGSVALLRAETLVARKDVEGAWKVLEAARQKQPKKEGLWIASVDLAVRQGKPELTQRILADAEQQLGDGAGLRLARLRVLLEAKDAGEELSKLETGLENFSKTDRGRVLAALAEAHYRASRIKEARRLWSEVVHLQPDNLNACLRSFDVALQGEDEEAVMEALASVRRLEGEGGSLGHYSEARRLIWRASHGDKSGLAAARSELAAVSKRRPGWSRVPLCLGQIWDLEGKEERALEHYLRAIELGERQLELIRRVVRLLYDHGRYTEAESVIERLPRKIPLFGDLQRLVAEVALRTGDYNRALEAARGAIQTNSREHRDYIWLGQILWIASQRAELGVEQRRAAETEAEQALNRAVELASDAPESWIALVQLLARTKQLTKAVATIEKARAQLPAQKAPLTLAQCHVALSQLDKAHKLFAAALKSQPEDVTTLQTAANFYLKVNELPAAESCLRKLATLGAENAVAASQARSLLAVVLAAEGGDERSREALTLLSPQEKSSKDDLSAAAEVQRERALAVVLAMRQGRQEQRKAIDILERLSARQPLSAEDRFLLVQLYERIGNYAKARERMLPLLKSGDNRYLAHYVNTLLQHGMADKAEVWMAQLENREPNSLRTALLKARLLNAQDQRAEAGALLKQRAEGQDAPVVLRIAAMLEDIGCGADALALYRQYAKQVKKPEANLPLARCLARQNQLAEALKLCDQAWATCPPAVVAEACLTALQESHPDTAHLDSVERHLKEALEKDRESPQLILCLGWMHELRGHYQEAENLYRQVIQRDPRNAVALNNLAWILALRDGKGEEALRNINRAIEVRGPIPEMLDTRAIASLVAGRTDAALTDLQDAFSRLDLTSKVRFSIAIHLARAYLQAGNAEMAKKFWREAHARDVRVDGLHGLERSSYEKLAQQLGRQGTVRTEKSKIKSSSVANRSGKESGGR